MTAEINRLCKLLRLACPDLYLALGGGHPEVELPEKVLKTGFRPVETPQRGAAAHACRELPCRFSGDGPVAPKQHPTDRAI